MSTILEAIWLATEPIRHLFLTLMVFMGLDMVSAMFGLKKYHYESFENNKFKEGIYHKLQQLLIVVIACFLDFFVMRQGALLSVSVLLMFIGVEAKSVLDNFTGKVPKELIDTIDKMIRDNKGQ